MQPLDLARDEEGLVDGITLTRHDYCGRRGDGHGSDVPRGAARMGRDQQALGAVEGLLRAAAAILQALRGAAIDSREVTAQQARNGPSEPVDRLGRGAENDQALDRLGRGAEPEHLALLGGY